MDAKIEQLISAVLLSFGDNRTILVDALKILLTKHRYSKLNSDTTPISIDEFLSKLATINEKEKRRKTEGVYYTPKDVTEYIVANTFLTYCEVTEQVYPVDRCLEFIQNNTTFVENIKRAKVFDPTCGAAEFLLTALQIKVRIAQSVDALSDDVMCELVSTIHGNDIAPTSIDLTKLRLFFYSVNLLKDKSKAKCIAKTLNRNTSKEDFIVREHNRKKYDIVLGNPPYIEYGGLKIKPSTKFGNSYADVMTNSIDCLKKDGTIGFVIPLSFVSTPRMERLRDITYDKLQTLYVLNFADRPDCLFNGVHQKLTILFGKIGNDKCNVYSSSYTYWYQQDRDTFLNACQIYPVKVSDQFIPKIGKPIECEIFENIIQQDGQSILDIMQAGGDKSVYLNMRGCFWMKAFTFNPGSAEYNELRCSSDMQPYLTCILNSSIFFLFWTIVSDCWHITNKELSLFKIPKIDSTQRFLSLATALQNKLEETKKYIGSKQVEYEYKHRDCKKEIDDIDEALQQIFNLTDTQIEYIKNYKLNYRMSNGKI